MSTITLSHKAVKLMTLCDLEGFDSLEDLLQAAATDSVCPAICMTEGCDHTADMETDQTRILRSVRWQHCHIGACTLAGLI
jgi:hypothetical protein